MGHCSNVCSPSLLELVMWQRNRSNSRGPVRRPLIYHPQDRNWLLHSVGLDGVDGGGESAGRELSTKGNCSSNCPEIFTRRTAAGLTFPFNPGLSRGAPFNVMTNKQSYDEKSLFSLDLPDGKGT